MWARIGVVFVKELVDNSRDRRALLMAMLYPLLGPVLLAVMITVVSGTVKITPSDQQRWMIQGIDNLPPDLKQFLENDSDIQLQAAPEDPYAAVQRGDLNAVIVLSDDFPAEINESRQADITVIIDKSRLSGVMEFSRISRVLNKYGRQLGEKRLKALGVDPSLSNAVNVASENVTRKKTQLVDFFLYLVPAFLVFTIFMGGFYLAVDTTSGERERGSMELLLINPVPRWQVMFGKYLATCTFTLAAVTVQLAAFETVFNILASMGNNFQRSLGIETVIQIVIVSLPLICMAVGVQVAISSMTRTYKEAQTWLSLLPLIPAAPALVMLFISTKTQTWMLFVPVYSQTLLFNQLIRGDAISVGDVAASASVTLLVALLLLWACSRLYEREAIIFGN